MDLAASNKHRANFTRYVAKTNTYRHLLSQAEKIPKDGHAFFRIRNESDYHAYAVKIKVNLKKHSTGAQFTDEYTFNMVASFCEYMLLIPQEYINNDYIDEYTVEISYLSISGETMSYLCKRSNNSKKVLNRYIGTYKVRNRKTMQTFELETYSDIIETIEVKH